MDSPELTGGKANTLVEIIQRLRLPAPDGFVITSRAYYRFLEHNRLGEQIHDRLEACMLGEQTLDKAAAAISERILAGVVPEDLAKSITRGAHVGRHNWSVRSSAYGEDGELSFAGLHQTLLNVPPSQILEAYKMVVASLYSPEAVSYRHQMGMTGDGAAMSVLCQKMVNSQASGVLQTVCPESSESDCMAIYASFGLGRTTAEGRDTLDEYIVRKDPPHEIKETIIAEKELLLRSAAGGGEEEAALSQCQRTQSAISEETVRQVAKWGVVLERYFKRPLEIEWGHRRRGQLRTASEPPSKSRRTCCGFCRGTVAVQFYEQNTPERQGSCSPGRSRIRSGADCAIRIRHCRSSDGAVLVTRYTAPWLARIVPKACAIISERGSVVGHLATIAREFRFWLLLDWRTGPTD